MKSEQTLAVLFYLSKKRMDKDGNIPIYFRLSIDGRRSDYSLSEKIREEQWDSHNKLVIGISPEALNINLKILNFKKALQKQFIVQTALNDYVTPECFISPCQSFPTKRMKATSPAQPVQEKFDLDAL